MSDSTTNDTDKKMNDATSTTTSTTTTTSTATTISTNESEGLHERYLRGITCIESDPKNSISLFESILEEIGHMALFSSNETMEDVSTKSIPYLSINHYLAMSLINLPSTPDKMAERKQNLYKSFSLWDTFLMKLEQLEVLSKNEINEYQSLLEEEEGQDNVKGRGGGMTTSTNKPPPLSSNRDAKIARYKQKQQIKKELEQLKAYKERRVRVGMTPDEEMDGHDEESLHRSVELKKLSININEAIEQWSSSKRELPMIDMMIKMEQERHQKQQHRGGGGGDQQQQRQRPLSGKPLQVTRITKDAASGKLNIKKEEIRSKVFRPGWNQPTMTLEELGDREYRQAMEREEKQRIAEAQQSKQPRRYEDLVRDEMEDNANLVDASAKLDRDWDDWKDENPRGSGNKMANRGDKNF